MFQVRDLLGYALTVGHAHQIGNSSSGWKEYDLMFRTRTPLSARWSDINTAYWQITVNRPTAATPTSAPYNLHQPAGAVGVQSSGVSYRTPIAQQLCFAYNDGRGCPGRPECRRRHECRTCGDRHPEINCAKRRRRNEHGTINKSYFGGRNDFSNSCDIPLPPFLPESQVAPYPPCELPSE